MIPDMAKIEPRFKESLDAWATKGHLPGGFLCAVLENNFMEAMARGDSQALENAPHIAQYVYNVLPSGCWGSKEKMREWRRYIEYKVEAR
jgi:hypothetical protein